MYAVLYSIVFRKRVKKEWIFVVVQLISDCFEAIYFDIFWVQMFIRNLYWKNLWFQVIFEHGFSANIKPSSDILTIVQLLTSKAVFQKKICQSADMLHKPLALKCRASRHTVVQSMATAQTRRVGHDTQGIGHCDRPQTCPWTHRLSRFSLYDKLIYYKYIPSNNYCSHCTHERLIKANHQHIPTDDIFGKR